MPALTPLTVPVLLTKATAVLLLVHVPPATPSDKVVIVPAQIVVVPLSAVAALFTATAAESILTPQALVSV